MENGNFNTQSGKSLIELIIVVVIVMIITTFAVLQTESSKKQFNRQNLAREFKVYLERARFDSMKRRPAIDTDKARIVINNATSYTAIFDLNQNGAIDAGDKRELSTARSDVNIVGFGLVFPITISFDWQGQIKITNGASVTSTTDSFIICQSCITSTANNTNANTVSISPTGTVVMLAGTQTLSTAQNPTVTNEISSIFNPLVRVPN